MSKRLLAVLLTGIAAVLLLYFVPSRKAPVITRYDRMADSARTVLPAVLADSLDILEMRWQDAKGSAKRRALEEAAAGWTRAGFPALGAERLRQAADLEPPDVRLYGLSGDAFFDLCRQTTDDAERVDYVFHAIYCYEKVLSINPDDLERKVRLATCYTDYQGNIMQGVVLLREVAEADPGNSEAQMRLGRFALMSGQSDKAIERFRAILQGDSLNLPARILLAQTLANNRDMSGAREVLLQGLTLHSDSASREEIERLLTPMETR